MDSKTFGPAYDKRLDRDRLFKQHERIKNFMLDKKTWVTLAEIEESTGFPQSSISAQLRHLRKARFGSFIVEKKRRGTQWEYRVLESNYKNLQTELFL